MKNTNKKYADIATLPRAAGRRAFPWGKRPCAVG